jgi:mono/diheme cytochrome c family protein
MKAGRIVGLTLVLVLGLGVILALPKLANPVLPKREPLTRVVTLDQGWDPQMSARYHYTAQGTFLLPLAWMKSLEAGFFTSKKLTDPEILNGMRYITDGVTPDPKTNPDGLPIGWAVASWSSPQPGGGAASANVGFNCSTCHTGQLNYKGTGIRIEGGGSLADAEAFQDMVGKAILSTELLPWKKTRFVDEVSKATGMSSEAVSTALHGAFLKAVDGVKQSFFAPLYSPASYGRLDALQRIANTLFADDLMEPKNNHRGDAPVKYPYLWDISRLDWVQYNGSVRQQMMRNVGEALGVKAQTALVDPKTGQAIPEPARWNSSVNTENLFWMETSLHGLRAPVWPAEILGPIDAPKAAHGHDLFAQKCAGCHGIHVNQTVTPAEWKVTMIPLEHIGTDPTAATNFADYKYSAAKLGGGEINGAEGLKLVTTKVKAFQYDRLGLTPEQRAAWDGFGRQGEVRSPKAYKARPLVGIWASPPFLHNGSVPTLYDLLSPIRPATFTVGSREYDPIKVGYSTEKFPAGKTFETQGKGNSNAGHWFVDGARPGKLGPQFSEADRWALIEYLKSATYADYPCTDAVTKAPLGGANCGQ